MSKKVYIIVLGVDYNRDEVKKFIDSDREFDDWFYSLPRSIFVVSSLNSNDIFQKISNKFGKKRIFITAVDINDMQGWLPTSQWEKIKSIGDDERTA